MTIKHNPIKFNLIHNLAEILQERHLVTVSLSSQAEPIILSLQHSPQYRITLPSGVSVSKKASDTQNAFRVHYFNKNYWSQIDLFPTFENYHFIQPLHNDQWLAVRGRSNGIEDHNAFIYASSGQPLASFYVGDGVEDVQTDTAAVIWVSFFDEGIYSAQPISHSGLVAFNLQGHLSFQYKDLAGWPSTIPPIDDCYALNVVDSENVWAYYYTSFALVHLKANTIHRIWPELKIKGAHAFAIGTNAVYFAGSYKEKGKIFRFDFKDETIKKFSPVNEQGEEIVNFRTLARGNAMYLLQDKNLFFTRFGN